jgi:hypothetical protein
MPRWARKLRTAMSVSFETDTVQRMVSFGMTAPEIALRCLCT